jgi:uncharacterized protein
VAATPPPLPDALLDPACYPHHPPAVELRETHISWVLLAGDRAYKVKKPVRFPFLDYGTSERRRACCRAEVELDRRFAPGLYIGVVGLVPAGADRLVVAPERDARAVDYAVEMRRYDERDTLAARLAAGRIGTAELAGVGGALAAWHARAALAAPGGVERLAAVVEETVTSVTDSMDPSAGDERGAALARFARAALDGFDPVLRRRERAGRVRDGHGDLRAEHILLLDGGVQAVDGVEFDPELRSTDVGYDLAFLAMDVARLDEGLTRVLLCAYSAAGGDAGDERLMAFFCALRALVRAKVDFLRAAQLTGSEAEARRARALGLLELAERFAWRARLPPVLCVAGLSASGKSTLAGALAQATRRGVLSSDVVRKAAAGLAPATRAEPGLYRPEVSRATYAEFGRRAAGAVDRDGGVIVDATFRRAEDVDAFRASSAAAAQAGWIVCTAPPAVLKERARQRDHGAPNASDAGLDVVAAQLGAAPVPLPLPVPPLAELITTRSPAELVGELALALDVAMTRGVRETH